MSSLYITEYSHLAQDGNGMPIGAGREPAITSQKVTFTGTPGISSAFNANTRFIRLHADGIMSFRFGTGAMVNTDAVTSDPRQAASVTEYFALDPAAVGQGYKVAAITNT